MEGGILDKRKQTPICFTGGNCSRANILLNAILSEKQHDKLRENIACVKIKSGEAPRSPLSFSGDRRGNVELLCRGFGKV